MKTKDNKILKAGIGYTVGNYMIRGINFFALPVFARLMTTDEYGLYSNFVAFESILLYFIGLGIHASYKRARFKYRLQSEKRIGGDCYEEYSSAMMLYLILCLCLCILISLMFKQAVEIAFDMELFICIMLFISSFGSALILCYNSDRGLSYDYKGYIKVGLINALGGVSLSIILMLFIFDNNRYLARVIGMTVTMLIISLIVIVFFWKRHNPSGLKKYSGWGLKYSIPVIPHGLSQVVLTRFDQIMIKRMIGASSAGIYSFAYNLFSIIYITYRSLDTVWGQWFFEKKNEHNDDDIKKYSSLYLLMMLSFSICVMLISPELILVLGSSKYIDSIYCVLPIIAGGYFAFMYSLPCQVEYYYEKTIYVAIGSTGAAILNIVTNLYCIPKYGYIAAAYTTLVTYIVYFVFHYIIAIKIEKKNLFSNKIVVTCSISIFLAMAMVFSLINNILLRYCILITIVVLSLYFEEKEVSYLKKYILKRSSSK